MPKFKMGEINNPKGRPRNTGYRQKLFNSLVEPHKDALFDKAINLALDGNEPMLRIFLERMLPAKPTDDELSVEISLCDLGSSESLTALGKTILRSVASGDLTPSQGQAIMSVIESQHKNIETSELAIRLTEIEQVFKQRDQEK
ncbi:MAG TPA: hypothetical protein VLI69_06500 [Gammaproteobacteria bacterium]|nr:hypothetical protein [Gammaproteobacteria bacterium]